MDWETNLAAIIKCTDASLAQQFRQFEDVTAEFSAVDEAPVRTGTNDSSSDNVAAAYLRETMAAEYRHNQKQEQQPQQTRTQTPSYSRVFARGPATSAAPGTTFSEHFHRRQERKRGAPAATGRVRDNQRMHRRGSEYESAEDEGQVQDHAVDEPRYSTTRPAAGGPYQQQMYSSPTYDIAQMMEQVRLSLKLEVDARAAIAERQLSALLQLCKATSEELDRLRVEVCANDRQLHTLDQVQSKIRQELTTQKDIGFHLQSMCGKDESWRMQTENQLLELRQMVAALREQGNSTQALAQEKLSRSELLVQFNAAMEPIKAQLQANLQHQAQQIADITRTTSSSSLLLDGITQKVNRGITEELSELRSDLNALKHHVAKMDIFQDSGRGEGLHGRSPQPSKEEIEAKVKEDQQQQEKKLAELREDLQKELLALVKDYVDAQTKPIRRTIDENVSKFVGKQEINNLRSALEEGCRNRCASSMMQVDSQVKSAQEQLRGECTTAVRDTSDRLEKSIQQTASTLTTALDGQVHSWQTKHLDFAKMIESEQKERKQALDELHESLRKSRHRLEDQIHTLVQESRTKLSQHDGDFEKRLKDMEKHLESTVADAQKENQTAMTSLKSSIQVEGSNNTAEMEQKLKRLEDAVSSTNLSVAALSKSVASSTTTSSSASNTDSSAKDVSLALEKQTSVYVSTMETLLQKMQLQLQLQAQPQVQMTMAPSPYHGFWPSSPYAASQASPAPLLHLPSAVTSSSAASTADQTPVPPTTTTSKSVPLNAPPRSGHPPVNSSVKYELTKMTDSIEEPTNGEKADDRVRTSLPVKQPEHLNAVPISPSESSPVSSPPTVNLTSTSKAASGQTEQQSSQQNLNKEDDANKRENTLATTAKGALAEAELAKARVENRRKQEMKQQQWPPTPAASVNTQNIIDIGVSAFNKPDTVDTGSRRPSIPGVLAPQTPVLTRSASSSALPGQPAAPHPVVTTVGNKVMSPASVPSTPTAGGSTRIITNTPSLPPSIPPQTAKTDGVIAVPVASNSSISNQIGTKNETKPPLSIPIANSAPPTAPKSEIGSAGLPSTQPAPKDSTPSLSQPNAPRQNTPQELTLSVPGPPAKDEAPPPLSPLAKIFARSTPVETAQVDDEEEDLAPAQSVPNANISPAINPVKIEEKIPVEAAPTTASASPALTGAPVSHVLCGLCRLPVRSDQKAEHEKSLCPKRMVEYVSCKQQLQWVNLEMHELECNNVQRMTDSVSPVASSEMKPKPLPDADTAADFGGSLKKCRHCSADVPSLDLLEHEINCDKVLKQCPHCLRRQKMSELQEHIENCDCRLVSCPNDCGGKFLQRGIPNHLATRCPKKPVATSAPVVTPAPRQSNPEANKPPPPPPTTQTISAIPPTGKVECKFCDDEIEASKIDDHEQNCDWKPKRCQHCNMVVISRDLLRHETSCKTNMKFCPHCNENMPQSALTTHASRCSKRPIKCIRCCQLFPADAIVAHSTNCKFVPGTNPTTHSSSPQPSPNAASRTPIKIPPPPPFPPPPTATTPVQQNNRRATEDPRMAVASPRDIVSAAAPAEADRLARRNLALSQLTNPGGTPEHNNAARASAPSMYPTATSGLQSTIHVEDEEEDDDEEEDEDEENDDQLTLAQVVKEWSVENVCLWLHEDVGVPDVVLRFQQKQCNGEMLLELTESDLINDFGVNDRVQRERILSAIEAINTSNAFSDEDYEEDEDDLEESEDYETTANSPSAHMRHSIGGAFAHPRDILRRKSQPSPERLLGGDMPSSNDMLRRISSALENPKR